MLQLLHGFFYDYFRLNQKESGFFCEKTVDFDIYPPDAKSFI